MSLYKRLYDIPFNLKEKKCKNGATMFRLDFGPVTKYPSDEPGTRSYDTCIGVFINKKSIMISFYTHIFFRPMKGKRPLKSKRQEYLKWKHENRNQPMLSRVVYGTDRLVFAPTKKNGIFRCMHFNDRQNDHVLDKKTGKRKTVKGKKKVRTGRLEERDVSAIERILHNYVRKIVETRYKFSDSVDYNRKELAMNVGTVELIKVVRNELEKKGWNIDIARPLDTSKFPITKPKSNGTC